MLIPAFLCRLNFCLNVYYKDIFIVFAFLSQRGFYFTTSDVISYLLSWLPRMIHLWYFLSVFPIFSGGCHVFSLWQMFCNLIMIFCLRHLWGSWFWKFLIFSNWSSGSNSFYIHTRVNSSCMLFSLSLKSHNRHSLLHLCAEYCSHFCVLTLWSWRTALCFQICRSFSGWSAVRPNTPCFVCCFQLYSSLPLFFFF